MKFQLDPLAPNGISTISTIIASSGSSSTTSGGTDVTLAGEDYLTLVGQQITANPIDLDNLSATGTPSSSTFLRGDNTWATPAGSGDVSKVGTPVNNQVGVWTGDGTIEGDADLTFDTTTNTLTTVNIAPSGTVDGRDVATDGTKLDGIEALADVTDATNVAAAGAFMKSTDDTDDITEGATNKWFTSAEETKLAGIEALADVTDAANVDAAGATMNADTSLAGNGYFLDEDNMASNSATKVPSQQSVKAYVDAQSGVDTVVAGNNIDVDSTDPANPIVSVETLTLADISDVTASAAEVNILDGATLSTTELNYVDGVTSAIQTQLNGKLANVVEDTTPQLGGDLDTNAHNIQFDDTKSINDDSGNELVVFHKTASAVNQLGVYNGATGSAPALVAEGDNTNINLFVRGKGSGSVIFADGSSNNVLVAEGNGGTPVNYLALANSNTTAPIPLTATGTDTDISVNIVPKGTGRLQVGGVNVPTISSTDAFTNKTFDSSSPTAFFYPGFIQPAARRTAPTGWLFCDGSAVSRTTYANLFAAVCESIGTFTITIASPGVGTLTSHGMTTGEAVFLTTTGALPTGLTANTLYYLIRVDANTFRLATSRANAHAGTAINTSGTQSGTHTLRWAPYSINDSTTFNLPDLRGMVLAGRDDMGGTAVSVLTVAGSGIYGANVGAAGGAQVHTLTTAQIPSHSHTFQLSPWGGDTASFPSAANNATNLRNGTTNTTGGGGAHQNTQPTIITNYFIKT